MTYDYSRRNFLKQTGFLVGAAALSPAFVTRADATPGIGELAMIPATPNPTGNIEKLFLLKGDPLATPITTIVSQTGAAVPAQIMPTGTRQVLRVLHFNDMHNHITEISGKKGNTHRFAQLVKMVKDTRASAADNEAILFLSGGDDHTGSVFDELMGWAPDEFVADAGYRAASVGGVDIGVLGNHEFDRGAELLKTGIQADARFPLLSANIHSSSHLIRDVDYVPAVVAEIKGLRIGIIGLTTAIDVRTGLDSDPTLAVASPVEAVKNIYKAVESVSDVVVILSHCGYGKNMHSSGKAATARNIGEGDFSIAEAIGPMSQKPVVLVGGHSHTTLNKDGIDADNMVSGVLLTQAKAHGKYLGEISMSIGTGMGRNDWFSSVSLHGTKKRDKRVNQGDEKYATLEQDGDFDAKFEAATIAPMLAALEVKMAEVIGTVDDDTLLNTDRTFADRYVGEVAIGNFMNDALVERSPSFPGGAVDFALFNATGFARGIDKGPLSFTEWFDVMPYADNIDVATITGAQIRDMLHSNAKRLLRPNEVAGTDLSGFVSRGLLHFSKGIRYRIALGDSAAEAHAVDITLNGISIDDVLERKFTMAFNSYISLGAFSEAWNGKPISGGVPNEVPGYDVRGLPFDRTGLVYRNEIIAMIRTMGTISTATGAALDGRVSVV